MHPVNDSDHRKISTPWFAGSGIGGRWPCRAVTTTQVIESDDKKFIGIQRSTGTDDVVPPTDIVRLFGIVTGDVMMTR